MKTTLIAAIALTLSLTQTVSADVHLDKEIDISDAGKSFITQVHGTHEGVYGDMLYTRTEEGDEGCSETHGLGLNKGTNLFVASSTQVFEGNIEYHRIDVRKFPEPFETYACANVTGMGANIVEATANALETAVTNRSPAKTAPIGLIDNKTGEKSLAGTVSIKLGLISSYKEVFRMETDEGTYTSMNICSGPPIEQIITEEIIEEKKKNGSAEASYEL